MRPWQLRCPASDFELKNLEAWTRSGPWSGHRRMKMEPCRSDNLLLTRLISDPALSKFLSLLFFCRGSIRYQLKQYSLATMDATAALDIMHDESLSDKGKCGCFELLAASLMENGKAGEALSACHLAAKRLKGSPANGLEALEALKLKLIKARLATEAGPGISLTAKRQRDRRFDLIPSMIPNGLLSTLHLYGKSSDGKNNNLLLLLHGLGDQPKCYHQLATRMTLPQTCFLSLAGPLHIPLLEDEGGRSWFEAFDDDYNLIEPKRGEERRLRSLDRTTALVSELIEKIVDQCGFLYKEVHLFGFSQGGTCALEGHTRFRGAKRLGGCVSISGSILPESIWASGGSRGSKSEEPFGPVIVTVGGSETRVVRTEIDQSVKWLKEQGGDVRLHIVKGKGHEMVSSRDETRELMSFWAETLLQDLSNPQEGLYQVS